MKNNMAAFLAAAAASLAASAFAELNLSGKSDLRFAEQYAFATNRAALVATLPPESPAWYTYSILLAQTEGRLEDAGKLIENWKLRDDRDSGAIGSFEDRQTFLCWKDAAPKPVKLRTALGNCGITVETHPREQALAPNTYPSKLDPKEVSFEAFLRDCQLADSYRFLLISGEGPFADKYRQKWMFSPSAENLYPDTPGLFDAALAWLKSSEKSHVFRDLPVFRDFTLDQLGALAEALKDTEKDLRGNRDYAKVVLSKLTRGADEDPDDPAAAEKLARRRVAFAATLLPSLSSEKAKEYREFLRLMLAQGKCAEARSEFSAYIDLLASARRNFSDGKVRPDDVATDYLMAYRRAGIDVSALSSKFEQTAFSRICAEADLLAGCDPAKIAPNLFAPAEFKKIQERVELNWAKSNPKVFAPDDDVSLSIDVKNVKRMRIAVYKLDPYAACRILGEEANTDLDLDAAVPVAVRTVDYSRFASVVRHAEKLDLPELKTPGVYVVDCAGGGVASRAFVRKGRLRVTHHRDSAGHVFTALDEKGEIVKGTKLRLGETVFTADDEGEIAVPFAPDNTSAGQKTAIVTDGRLASTISFEHCMELVSLDLGLVLPSESLVAGCAATAILRPKLSVSGVAAPIALLKKPVLSATFIDLDRRRSVKTFDVAELSDDAETEVSFLVPERLRRIQFSLKGTVESAVSGKDEEYSASASVSLNGIAYHDDIGQALLRRSSSGWRVELVGLTGERLASRAVDVGFSHRVFSGERHVSLQADANGIIELGALHDITKVSLKFDGNDYNWHPGDHGLTMLPDSLSAAQGEDFELPVRDLLDGKWPGADKLRFRVALLELNAAGDVVADRLSACSYEDGVLRISGLPAGDYLLSLRGRMMSCRLYVAAAVPGSAGRAGVVASETRSLTDTGKPSLLRISSAERDANGVVSVRLKNFTPETRVHVFAARTFGAPGETSPAVRALSFCDSREVDVGNWCSKRSGYVSGRDLGERLRYILERRDQPRHAGNMLAKPSLLLSPWTTAESDTKDVKLRDGGGWDEDAELTSACADSVMRGGGAYGDLGVSGMLSSWDFMPEPEFVSANARPDADGCVNVRIPGAMQDVTVVATDGRAVDSLSVLGETTKIEPRNLVHKPATREARASIEKTYSTLDELYSLSLSLNLSIDLDSFRPLAAWPSLSEAAKRDFYGEHACHELDFFLYMKDRPFFDGVVAPNLRNKRLKEFMDKWLLGEDLSEYANPLKLGDLNALEQGLLAKRFPELAPVVARRMADWCEAHPTPPAIVDSSFDVALDTMKAIKAGVSDKSSVRMMNVFGSRAAPAGEVVEVAGGDEAVSVDCVALDEAPMPAAESLSLLEAPAAQAANMVAGAAMRKPVPSAPRAARRKEMAKRKNRQLYRPPERTREWVESNWWKALRDSADTGEIKVNEFWRDWTAAIAAKAESFKSANFCLVRDGFTAQLAALAVTDVPFAAKEGTGLVFCRERPAATGQASPVVVTQRFSDPKAERPDGSLGAEVSDEFVRGRVYELVTVLTNPTDERRRASAFIQIPEGAIALTDGRGKPRRAVDDWSVDLKPYSVVTRVTSFYFPETPGKEGGADSLALPPAEVSEANGSTAKAQPFACKVVAKPSKTDDTSWEYISQNGSKGAVLDYLREKNLSGIALEKIQWRMSDDSFAGKALDILSKRGEYCRDLWLAGLLWKGSFNASRIREALARKDNMERLGRRLGPALESPLATVDPELSGVFEHKEYWPIINARAHFVGGEAVIASQGLKTEYREFLDTLAAKRKPTLRDRVLAAVYLLAQDRIDEAKAQVAAAIPSKEPYKMQLDYLRAYLSFCDGDAENGLAIASPYANYPVKLWRDRFRSVIEQAQEVLGGKRPEWVEEVSDADAAPTLSMSVQDGSAVVSLTARNLDLCVVKAYPVDVEVAFSKDPFGSAGKGGDTVRCLAPAWSQVVAFKDGAASVELPAGIASQNAVIVAEGAEGRAEAKSERTPRDFDVQLTREYRQLRVKGRNGRPVAGAYVKVYAKDASGREVEFHKDGYTDLRGAFDYASISTDSQFKPAEFAILVIPEGLGAAVMRVAAE